mmetsp:Transcript_1484/g.5095  ORF Transcript_1484/g.5095 Transcript_1484/m.5095 type:complete len:118 (+) Transcript_1484:626-979(+)
MASSAAKTASRSSPRSEIASGGDGSQSNTGAAAWVSRVTTKEHLLPRLVERPRGGTGTKELHLSSGDKDDNNQPATKKKSIIAEREKKEEGLFEASTSTKTETVFLAVGRPPFHLFV